MDRHSHRTLREFVSRVGDECRCDTILFCELAIYIAEMGKSIAESVSSIIRKQTGLLIALAFAAIKNTRNANDPCKN